MILFDRPMFYILDAERRAVPVDDPITWAEWRARGDDNIVRVASDLFHGWHLSTVFLGIDHSFGGPTPILFETMLFKPRGRVYVADLADASNVIRLLNYLGEDTWRWATWGEAAEGHAAILKDMASPAAWARRRA